MLPRELLREEPERVRLGLASRGFDLAALDRWLALDAERRRALVEVEELKRQRNESSRAIGKAKQQRSAAAAEIAAVARLKERIESLEQGLHTLADELSGLDLTFPNLPHASVPVGSDETANRVERVVGEPT